MMGLDRYVKCLIAALVAGLGALQVALVNNSDVTSSEWVVVALSTVSALGFTWAMPNALSPEDRAKAAADLYGEPLEPPVAPATPARVRRGARGL